jgi:hypothetical protein
VVAAVLPVAPVVVMPVVLEGGPEGAPWHLALPVSSAPTGAVRNCQS